MSSRVSHLCTREALALLEVVARGVVACKVAEGDWVLQRAAGAAQHPAASAPPAWHDPCSARIAKP